MNRRDKTAFYMVYSLAVAVLVLSVLSSNSALVAISALSIVLAVALLHSGHILNAILVRRTGVVEVSGRYQLGQDMHSVSCREGELFKAVSVAILHLRDRSSINQALMKDLLDSIDEPFEFSIEMAEINKERLIENLRTKLRIKEIALSRTKTGQYDRSNWLRRQIDVINSDIASLSAGGKSFEYLIRLRSICVMPDEAEAKMYSARNIQGLASKFSVALSADYEILYGEGLLEHSGV